MKKLVILLTALAMIAGFSTVSFAGIQTSAHDLSDDGLGSTEICIFCHVPHTADTSVTDAPLWNHTLTTQNFDYYTAGGGTTNAAATGISRLCLSCHDGVTEVDAFGGNTPAGGNNIQTAFPGTTANVGTNLLDDHPVMVAYPAPSAGNFKDSTTFPTPGPVLFSGSVECGSCHDPHDTTNTPFLRMSNATSALCLACHDK